MRLEIDQSPNDIDVIRYGTRDDLEERLLLRSRQLNHVLYALALFMNPPRSEYHLDPDALLADVLETLREHG